MPVHALLAALADGQPHHITELARATSRLPHQLNALWQQVPAHLRGLLRQRDGVWHLVRPIAWPHGFVHHQFTTRVVPSTTSSNDELIQAAKNGEHIQGHAVVALSQENGRGRQGRAWQARSGECLTFSLGWVFAQEQAQLGALAPVVALACQQALAELGCSVQIKWPNDLVVGLDKLGGILIETVRCDGQTHVVIGIGINFVLPKELDRVTAIQSISSKKHTAEKVLQTLFNHLYAALNQFTQQGFMPFQAAYQAAHRDNDQDIVLLHHGEVVQQGRVQGIAEDGALLLNTSHGLQKIITGEVSLRRPEQVMHTHATFRQSENVPVRYLLLDAGNSRLKWAWIENDEIQRTSHAPYRDLSRLQEEWVEWGDAVQHIVGSAVCGEAKKSMVAQYLPQTIQWLPSMPRALNITNHYRHPEEHGADRWFNALGSRRFSENASVVVSCGTAVTVDAITFDRHYLGGSIMPGFHLMRESLVQKTAQLQRPEGARYPFPTTTANAIATGMMDAVCGAIILMHARLQQRSGSLPVDLIITGGGAAKVAAALPEHFVMQHTVKVIDNLVMYGLLDYLKQHLLRKETQS